MPRRIVISQPMYLPWAGLFEQMLLADVFIHLDDADFSKGGFLNRVQLKTANGTGWLTVPVHHHLNTPIHCTTIDYSHNWPVKHLRSIEQALSGQPFRDDALALIAPVYEAQHADLASLNQDALERIAAYLGIAPVFMRSSEMNIPGQATERVRDLVLAAGGDCYITGHGARHYMQHELLEASGIAVEYMDYAKTPYAQKYGAFNPFVTILDLIASQGPQARHCLAPRTVDWRAFLSRFQPPATGAAV